MSNNYLYYPQVGTWSGAGQADRWGGGETNQEAAGPPGQHLHGAQQVSPGLSRQQCLLLSQPINGCLSIAVRQLLLLYK
jgi:hypothetical protein